MSARSPRVFEVVITKRHRLAVELNVVDMDEAKLEIEDLGLYDTNWNVRHRILQDEETVEVIGTIEPALLEEFCAACGHVGHTGWCQDSHGTCFCRRS